MTGAGRLLLGVLLAGWLADELARPDGDVEAGIEAYEAGDLDAALEHFDVAIVRHGDRPELSFDRGLVLLAQEEPAEARRAFERATEAEDAEIRASAFYEVGNVAFDAEDYAGAIEAYIECLKARPDHSNAKWNLELAQQRLEEQEDEDEDEEEDEDSGDTGGDESGTDETGGSDTGGDDSGTDDTGGSETGGGTGGEDGDSGTAGGEESGGEDTGGQQTGDSGGETGEDEPPPEDTDEPPEQGTGGETPPPPAPVNQMDLQKALEELDEQDHFPLDRPVGGQRPPVQDW